MKNTFNPKSEFNKIYIDAKLAEALINLTMISFIIIWNVRFNSGVKSVLK